MSFNKDNYRKIMRESVRERVIKKLERDDLSAYEKQEFLKAVAPEERQKLFDTYFRNKLH